MKIIKFEANSREEFINSLNDIINGIENEIVDEASLFSFPAIKTDGCSVSQLSKIFEEISELACAINCGGTVFDVLTEAWDVIQATETLIRIIADFDDAASAHDIVLDRNQERGYYEISE